MDVQIPSFIIVGRTLIRCCILFENHGLNTKIIGLFASVTSFRVETFGRVVIQAFPPVFDTVALDVHVCITLFACVVLDIQLVYILVGGDGCLW